MDAYKKLTGPKTAGSRGIELKHTIGGHLSSLFAYPRQKSVLGCTVSCMTSNSAVAGERCAPLVDAKFGQPPAQVQQNFSRNFILVVSRGKEEHIFILAPI